MIPKIFVVDGMGGGIGAQLVSCIKKTISSDIELYALGTNAIAAKQMAEAGASKTASGENAFRISLQEADFILGPLGIVIPDSMMGELTKEMAEYVMLSKAQRILLPFSHNHFFLVGLSNKNMASLIQESIDKLSSLL